MDILTLGIAQTVTSVSVIGGFIVTDFALQRVNWQVGNTWLWIALFLVIGLVGMMLMGISRQRFDEVDRDITGRRSKT